MVHARRQLLQAAGFATVAGLAGCTMREVLNGADSESYHLEIEPFGESLIESTLYEPSTNEPFAEPAETALSAVLPDGEHTTYGFKPTPEEAYVEDDGQFFQLTYVVSGRRAIERDVILLEPLDDETALPEEPPQPEEFTQTTKRVLTLLHTHHLTGADSPVDDELDNGEYVLRRPAERESRLASGELDETVFAMTDGSAFAYRIHRKTNRLREPRYVLRAIPITDSETEFTETLRATEIDSELNPETLAPGVETIIEEAIMQSYSEESPISDSFDSTLGLLNVDTAELPLFNAALWYDEAPYRYSVLYENTD